MITRSTFTPKFVGRKKEINLVEELIGIIQYGGSVFQAVLNFYGVVGIGKTILLQELEKLIRDRRLLCALIDFDMERSKNKFDFSLQGQVKLLQSIRVGFSGDPGGTPTTKETSRSQQNQEPNQSPEHELQATVKAFLDDVNNLVQDHNGPAVLLLDTLEMADQELLDWLEDEIISPLIRTDRVLVVAASRAPHRWKRFEVRRRALQYRLEPFDEETTEKQLPREYKALVPDVMRLTYGHPFGNVQVVQSVRQIEQEMTRSFSRADFDEHQKRLVQELVDRLIEPLVMRDVPEEIKRAYRVMALARQFDVNVLRRLLTRFVAEPFASKSAAYFLSVVGTMVKTTLVEWSSARRGYVLDQTIRWMLALNMQLLAQERYEEINRELIELYDEWIKRVEENRSGFIIERLYHEACLQDVRGDSGAVIAERLYELLRGYLEKYYKASENGEMPLGLTTLKEELSTDEELASFLTSDQRAGLIEIVEGAINQEHVKSEAPLNNSGGQQ